MASGQYYAHPRNTFWRLMADVVGRDDLPALPYDERLAALLDAKVGLWDVMASAERPGSLDAAIREPQAADLTALIAGLPDLRAIAFNGATASRLGRHILAGTAIRLIDLPSSSPAHARPLAEKAQAWSVLREILAG